MNPVVRHLHFINLGLLVGLGALCLVQRSKEHAYSRRVTELQHTVSNQSDLLAEGQEAARRLNEDLAGFKTQVAYLAARDETITAELRQRKAELFSAQQEVGKLKQESATWQQTVGDYKKAIEGRDEDIHTLLGQREKLIATARDANAKANEAIVAYNEVAAKYETVVQHYNDLAAQVRKNQPEASGNSTTR